MERTDFEAPPHVFVTQEAGASDALRSQAEPGNEFKFYISFTSLRVVLGLVSPMLAARDSTQFFDKRQMSDKPKCYAILPAAGRSRRMGQPKLLLPWPNGGSNSTSPQSDVNGIFNYRVIDHVLKAWTCSRIDEIVVVVRKDDQALKDACSRWRVSIVQPEVAPGDMKESVQHGIRYLQNHRPNSSDRFFVAPADTPTISSAIINRLADVAANQDAIVVPSFAGRLGHPVLLPWGLSQEVFGLGENEGVDQVVSRHPQMMVEFDADERVGDVDTPDEYQAAFELAQKRRNNQQ